MKLLLCVLGVFLIAGQVYCDKEVWKARREECKKEVGLPDEKPKGPPDMSDPKVKCFMACMAEKGGIMEGGKVDEAKTLQMAKKPYPDADEAVIKGCITKGNAESDKCEVAGAIWGCLLKELGPPKHKGGEEGSNDA